MSNIAFIPARGGSKSIKNKNIVQLHSKPLIYWVIRAAVYSNTIDKVVIATDSDDIIREIKRYWSLFPEVTIYVRNHENAKDESSTESVLLEWLESCPQQDKDYIFLIQATSPMLTALMIDKMHSTFMLSGKESAIACTKCNRFMWSQALCKPLNYDYKKRPRRQDFKNTEWNAQYIETGACYINKVSNILRDKNRLTEPIYMHELPSYMQYEIDEPDDLAIVNALMFNYGYQYDIYTEH